MANSGIDEIVEGFADILRKTEKSGFRMEFIRNSFVDMEKMESRNPEAQTYIYSTMHPAVFALHVTLLNAIQAEAKKLGLTQEMIAKMVGDALRESQDETIVRFRNSFDIP